MNLPKWTATHERAFRGFEQFSPLWLSFFLPLLLPLIEKEKKNWTAK
jgi:hypothetical protein